MTHAVVNAAKIHAQSQEADVRPVVSSGCALDNGNIFSLNGKYATSGSGMEVWAATLPATGSLVGLWMALEPELPFATAGTKTYNGLGTVQDFYTPANRVFTAVKLVAGDIFSITDDGLKGSHSTGSFICAVDGEAKWAWAAVPAASAAYCQFLNTVYFSIPDGSIGDQRVTAYQFEVKANS
jgi:hypothetical protein